MSKFKLKNFNKFDLAAANMSMSFEKKKSRERSNSDFNNFISNPTGSCNIIPNYTNFKNSINGNLNNSL